ncbi:hypothetical protein J6590_083135 [Homalodisca vitripennis]|nr:hypothetical protein J6590_083135 [Homalodisca vitripennis]
MFIVRADAREPRTYGIMSEMFKDRPVSRLVTTKWYIGPAHQARAVKTFSIIPSCLLLTVMSAMFKDRPVSRLVTTKWYLGPAHQAGAVNTFSIIPSYVCF